jgi:hypothetical protein
MDDSDYDPTRDIDLEVYPDDWSSGDWRQYPEISTMSGTADAPVVPRRREYGRGAEAARTSQVRSYDISQSKVYEWLQAKFKSVSKQMLLHLIRNICDACKEMNRPPPPSRTQMRVKNGLVQWLDDYEPITFPVLKCLMIGK